MEQTDRTTMRPIERVNLAEAVYRELIRMITRLEIEPGARLHFERLGKIFNVSRAPLREAVQRLMAEGLVWSEPQMGYYVVRLNRGDVRDLFEVRRMLERTALRRSIGRIPASALRRLRDGFAEALDGLTGEDPPNYPGFEEQDTELHFELIVGAAGSRILDQLSRNIRHYVELTRHLHWRIREALREHIEIIDAIIAQDVAAAEQALDDHLLHSMEQVVTRLEAGEQETP
jgi:DNA-binding GntR family transcriptional regulator